MLFSVGQLYTNTVSGRDPERSKVSAESASPKFHIAVSCHVTEAALQPMAASWSLGVQPCTSCALPWLVRVSALPGDTMAKAPSLPSCFVILDTSNPLLFALFGIIRIYVIIYQKSSVQRPIGLGTDKNNTGKEQVHFLGSVYCLLCLYLIYLYWQFQIHILYCTSAMKLFGES